MRVAEQSEFDATEALDDRLAGQAVSHTAEPFGEVFGLANVEH